MVTEAPNEVEAMPVAKQPPKKSDRPDKPKSFLLKFPKEVEDRILAAAEAHTLDPTSFLRMVIRKSLHNFENPESPPPDED